MKKSIVTAAFSLIVFNVTAQVKISQAAPEISLPDYTFDGSTVRFSYKFEEEDSFAVTIPINNKPVLGYFAEVSE